MTIVWRDKLLAFSIHFIATALLAACAAALIFLVWYPDPFQAMVRGTELFMLVVGCDLALGPLLSFVVFNRSKTRRALVIDYSFIAIAQIAGLVYGVYTVAESRPVYVAFSTDRLEVVAARDLLPAELAAAREPQYRKIPLTGPRFVAVKVPEADRQQSLFDELDGKPAFVRPRWYHEYASALPEIRKRLRTLPELEKRHPDAKALIAAAVADAQVPAARLGWMPVSTRRGFWTALVDNATGMPAAYLKYDPY
jgi:hypothetical protein